MHNETLARVRRLSAWIKGPRGQILLFMAALAALLGLVAGCGTTKMTDTRRTGTEQLLISTAVDRAVNQIDFQQLAGKDVFLDTTYLKGVEDENYVVSTLRQHMVASGCRLRDDREDATYIIEARAGAVGTNRSDLLVGVPQTNVPSFVVLAGAPSTIPEIPFVKKSEQKGVAKIVVFAYHRETGHPVWQSGAFPTVSNAKDTWFMGAGPFQSGSIYDGTRFAGQRVELPFKDHGPSVTAKRGVPVTAEVVFDVPPDPTIVAQTPAADDATDDAAVTATASQAPTSADGSSPRDASPGSTAPGSKSPFVVVPGSTDPAGGQYEGVPTGYIMRLPPTEQDSVPTAPSAPGMLDSPIDTHGPVPPAGVVPSPNESGLRRFDPRRLFQKGEHAEGGNGAMLLGGG